MKFARYFADIADNVAAAKRRRVGEHGASPSAAERMAALRQRVASRCTPPTLSGTAVGREVSEDASLRPADAAAHAAASQAWHTGSRLPEPGGGCHLSG